jgi:hypothetical protein
LAVAHLDKKTTIIVAIIGAAGVIIAAGIGLVKNSTGSNLPQTIQGSPGAIQAGRDVTIHQADPQLRAVAEELLRRTEKPIYEVLQARFPKGYALIYADNKKRLTYEVRGEPIEIDWSKLALVELSDSRITIIGPGIRGAGFTNPQFTAKRVVGASGAAEAGNFHLVFEVLRTTPEGVVAVVGACASGRPFCPERANGPKS